MDEVKQKLEQIIQTLYGAEVEVELALAPEETGADYATNVAMKLAKVAHKAPMVIAEELRERLIGDGENMEIRVEIVAPGFMNFMLPDEYFERKIADFDENGLKSEKIISWDEYRDKVVVTEFSDPNPFKVLHVGHLYTSVVGDSISRILEFAGAKVERVNFGGDVGLHVSKTMWALLSERTTALSSPVRGDSTLSTASLRASSLPCISSQIATPPKSDDLTIERIAECYVEGTWAYDEDETAKAEITKLNKVIYAISELGEEKSQERLEIETIAEDHEMATAEVAQIAGLYWQGRKLSYDYFKDFYAQIGVKFDKFYPESTVVDKGVEEVQAHIGLTYEESDGAIVYRGEKVGLHTRVFINREGVPTYETKDVGLIFTKWADWHFDESVVITGNEQTDYMKVVLASVKEYAPELVERTRHLTHGMVRLPGNEKMSSRKGNFLKAVDVIGMIQEMLGGATADSRIVLAAIKYAFLKYKMGGDIVFDPKESVSTTGNSGVYLLYAAVRAKKILKKTAGVEKPVEKLSTKVVQPVENSDEEQRYERKLNKKIVQYAEVMREVVKEKAPYKLCNYLYELAQEFSRFYEHVKVAGSEREEERLRIVRVYLEVMEQGLGLLGVVEIPEEM